MVHQSLPDDPEGLLSLDPQLICYSWITGISDVALVVFVRKHQPEIQYLKASISEEQRREFGRLVETTVGHNRSGPVCLAQWYSLPPERLPQLLPSGALPQQPATRRYESHPQSRSERP
jgi:hypothetical protein